MNAATQNTWTSYRDGRRVIHYLRADGGRYFVQKVEAGYSVSFLADECDGVSIHMTTENSLADGKAWVESYTSPNLATYGKDAVGVSKGFADTTLADIVAKFEDAPLYECEIPGAPGGISWAPQAVSDAVCILPAESFGPVERPVTVLHDHQRAVALDAQIVGRTGRSTISSERKSKRVNLDEVDTRQDLKVQGDAIQYAFGAPGADPETLDFKALGVVGKLEVLSWHSEEPVADGVSVGMSTRWVPLQDPGAPTKAFPRGFADVIYFPMRKGIRKIVIRRKAK